MSNWSFPAPNPQHPDFPRAVESALENMAQTDFALSGEQDLSEDSWSALYQLDGINEVLEWNNEGVSADEIACMWLAQLRMLRTIHGISPDSAPFAPNRPLDKTLPHTSSEEADAGVLAALSEPEMQRWEKNVNLDVDDDAALTRALVLGFLPVDDPATVALLTARSTALTHAHPAVIWTGVALALTMRHVLATKSSGSLQDNQGTIREAVEKTVSWLNDAAPSQIPGDTSAIISLLNTTLNDNLVDQKLSSTSFSTLKNALAHAIVSERNSSVQESSALPRRAQLISAALLGAARPRITESHPVQTGENRTLCEKVPGFKLVLENFFSQLGLKTTR